MYFCSSSVNSTPPSKIKRCFTFPITKMISLAIKLRVGYQEENNEWILVVEMLRGLV